MEILPVITALVTLNFGAQEVVDQMDKVRMATQVVVDQPTTLREAKVLQESLQEVAVATQDKVSKTSQDQTAIKKYTKAIKIPSGIPTVLEVAMEMV